MPAMLQSTSGAPMSDATAAIVARTSPSVGDVAVVRGGVTVVLGDLCRGLLGRGLVEVDARDVRPFRTEPDRGGMADAGPRSGDDDDLAGEAVHVPPGNTRVTPMLPSTHAWSERRDEKREGIAT